MSIRPRRRLRETRVGRVFTVCCTTAVVGAAAFAFAPLQKFTEVVSTPESESSMPTTPPSERPLTLALYTKPLWRPGPTDRPELTVAVPKLPVQLLAIVLQDGARCAALYESDSGSLHILAEGRSIAGATVETITNDSVLLAHNGLRTRLALTAEESP